MAGSGKIAASPICWTVLRRSSIRLCAIALVAAWFSLAALGAPPPEADGASTTIQSSPAELKLLWEARQALFLAGKPAEARQKAAAILGSEASEEHLRVE